MSGAAVKYFYAIPAELKSDKVLMRLGYRRYLSEKDEKLELLIQKNIQLGLSICQPRGAFGRLRIIDKSQSFVRLENGVEFESRKLSAFLEDSCEIVMMAATVGSEIVERCGMEISRGNSAVGAILDAVASQTADSCLDWMMEFINKSISIEAKKLTKFRFSPGYGDLPITIQRDIYDLLGLHKLSLGLTENNMLIPEKSVTAFCGIRVM